MLLSEEKYSKAKCVLSCNFENSIMESGDSEDCTQGFFLEMYSLGGGGGGGGIHMLLY